METTVEWIQTHVAELIRYGGIVLLVALIVGGYLWYRNDQRSKAQEALSHAAEIQNAPVSVTAAPDGLSFPTEDAKRAAASKAYSDIISTYPGSNEAAAGSFYLAEASASQGKLDDARKRYQQVTEADNKNLASLGKLALAQLDFSNNPAEGERLLRDLIAHPTDLVSKDTATVTLAQCLAKTKPDEARKLLEPLRTSPGAVSSIAVSTLSALPAH